MRTPASITRRIQEVDSLYLAAHKYATDFPEDQFLRMNLEDLAYQKKELLAELEQSLISSNQHSLQYIFKTSQESLEIKTLSSNLAALSQVMDKQLDNATGGRKKRLPIYFNTVFSGSFGVQLSTAPEDQEAGQDFEKTLGDTLHTLEDLTTTEEPQLENLMKQTFAQDVRLLNRFSSLFDSIAKTGQEVEIRWHSPVTNSIQAVQVTPARAKHLVKAFKQQAVQEEEIEIQGVVKGVSLRTYWLELVHDPEGRDFIKAQFDKSLADEVSNVLNRYVVAQLLVTKTYSEARDEPKLTYKLLAVKPLGQISFA